MTDIYRHITSVHDDRNLFRVLSVTDSRFGSIPEETTRTLVMDPLASDIRKSLGMDGDIEVYITESISDFSEGESTLVTFTSFIVECGAHWFEFDSDDGCVFASLVNFINNNYRGFSYRGPGINR